MEVKQQQAEISKAQDEAKQYFEQEKKKKEEKQRTEKAKTVGSKKAEEEKHEDEWATVLKADLKQKLENEALARDSKSKNLRRYHHDLTSQIEQNMHLRDKVAESKKKEKHYSDLLLNRMQAD